MTPTYHSGLTTQVVRVGTEKQPVVIVDNLLAGAESLIDYAVQQGTVQPASGYYPGVRAPAPGLFSTLLQQVIREKALSED